MNNSIFRKNLYLMHKKGDVRNNYDDPDLRDWEGSTSKVSNSGGTRKSGSSGHWYNYDSGEPYTPSLIDKRDGRNNYSSSGSSSSLPSTPWSNASGTASRQSSGGNTSIGSGSSSSRKLADPSSNWSGETKRSATTYTPPSNGWGKEGSQEFKDNKKEYNQWYYQQNKDYWENYYKNRAKSPSAIDLKNNTEKNAYMIDGHARYYNGKVYVSKEDIRRGEAESREAAYRQAGEAYGKAMGNVGKTYSYPTRMTVADIVKQNSNKISAGNDYIKANSTVGNESLIENMWKSGAKSIINAGKSFLNAWKSGFGF